MLKTINEISACSVRQQRSALVNLENQLKGMDQAEVPLMQLLHAGMYVRAITVEKGTLLTGKVHKFDHIEIIVSGKIAMTTNDGKAKILEGFNVVPAFSGKKRAAYALEETLWLTVTGTGNTGEMTTDEVADVLTVDTFDEFDEFINLVDRADYENFLLAHNMTQDQMDTIVNGDDYNAHLNLNDFGVYLGASDIHGTGMFASNDLMSGEFIMPARVDGERTQGGRYVNHALRPNAYITVNGDDAQLIALKAIGSDEEITVNYNDVLSARHLGGDI